MRVGPGSCVAIIAILAVSGCNSISNRYVDARGKHGRGETTFSVTQSNGTFSISDEKVTCKGTFDSWSDATVVFPVTCGDGKSGTVVMTRPTADATMVAGEGTIEFTDGTIRRFVFGPNV